MTKILLLNMQIKDAIVICDKQDYLKEFQLQLANKSVYEEVKRDPLQGIMQNICNTLLQILKKRK